MRDRLFACHDWCAQHDDIPELLTLAATMSRWEDQIVAALLTGITNATGAFLKAGAAPSLSERAVISVGVKVDDQPACRQLPGPRDARSGLTAR